ncbi:hypothetical protein NDU88_002252 [Pleurodeles waltl]|uniref:Uncharacterized protein n=1 Tax=Pleurodeles waltl TaxID=8319 RepID=A0AAV7Q5G8_PLEWA|nr:hypothetical protein NDU88_002252 [Pleurodeles waltl]
MSQASTPHGPYVVVALWASATSSPAHRPLRAAACALPLSEEGPQDRERRLWRIWETQHGRVVAALQSLALRIAPDAE